MMSSSWGKQPRYGDFEIIGARESEPRLIGEGSFGKTYEALRQDMVAGGIIKEYVAVKVLNPALLASESKRFQFIQELVALTKFKHSNLIHYIRCGEENGEVYYAMELCRGGDLVRLVRRYGPLPERVVALIALQIAAGLREVHVRHRLVHRDIKPSNIMLVDELEKDLSAQHLAYRLEEQDSVCRIVDFGLVDFTLNAQDMQQRFVGSPMYASPEQIREQPVDGRSDIYSLGMTLWYLLQGKGPLLNSEGAELKDMREAMVRHAEPDEHEPNLPPHLSTAFRQILSRMVAKRPEQRYTSAGELQNALRHYLGIGPGRGGVSGQFSVLRMNESLETAYVLEATFPSRLSHRAYLAREKSTGRQVKLNIFADAQRNDQVSLSAVAGFLSELAELSRQVEFPAALLPVRDVIWSADMLACTEAMMRHVTLADVLWARATAKRSIGFSEAVAFLRPIAEALDFMVHNGRTTVFMPSEEIWLVSSSLSRQEDNQHLLAQPLTEWADLEVYFSMLCLQAEPEAHAAGNGAGETTSGSVHMSDLDLHPVHAFARLVYRIINGAEVAAAAGFTPHAYVPAVTLGHASNNLIRDTLWQKPVVTVTALLRELCMNEGLVWRHQAGADAPAFTSANSDGSSAFASPSSRSFGSAVPRFARTAGVAAGAGMRQSDGSSASFGFAGGVAAASSLGSVALNGGNVRSARSTAIARGSSFTGPAGSTDGHGRDMICEVLRPGVIRSPYDPEGEEQVVPPEHWEPSNLIRCQVTQRIFRLPRKLSPLPAQVLSLGVIQSPYAPVGTVQRLPWDLWIPGGEVICEESGHRIALPLDLPLPEGILPPDGSGVVISPYDRGMAIEVEPNQWEPGAEVVCPTTQSSFVLPSELPPLGAIADVDCPGVVSSPYAPAVNWRIPPAEWIAGRKVECPATRKPLTLPGEVAHWPAEAIVVDASQRLLSNPFHPCTTVRVPASNWIPGSRTTCPETGRTILLPADLPPLTGELVNDRPGVVRSPFSGEVISVALNDWVPGTEITCPKAHARFILPATIPEWIPAGSIAGLPLGKIRSPFDPCPEVDVPLESWRPNHVLSCPASGRRFCLPEDLELPKGVGLSGRTGIIQSPYSGQWQNVPIEQWVPGRIINCEATGRAFILPPDIDEWQVDGFWVPGSPGKIRSPFAPHPEFEVPLDQWCAGGSVDCPATARRFRIPEETLFPSLALEKAAFRYGQTKPESTSEAAAQALFAVHPGVTSTQVQAIWERHGMGRLDDRLRQVQVGEALPEAPGFVRSPYGGRRAVKVPPVRWSEPRAVVRCPETGRPFLMPEGLSPLIAALKRGEPGMVISPYAPEKAFAVDQADWTPGREIKCPHTGQRLRLPRTLPEWNPADAAPAESTAFPA